MTHESLKDSFVNTMVQRILTGKLRVGEMLPSERVLTETLGISRNVVRVGLAELTTLGFLRTEARRGTFVTDYLRDGNLLTLAAVRRAEVPAPPHVLRSMLDFRMTTLCESAGLCAERRSSEELERLAAIMDEQARLDSTQNEEFTRLDFLYHKEIYVVSGNIVYPMIQNSIRMLHHSLALEFYKTFDDKGPIKKCHGEVYRAIEKRDPEGARKWMREVLELGDVIMAELSYFS